MGLCLVPVEGKKSRLPLSVPLTPKLQLPDPNAKSFTPHILKTAMMDAIASINELQDAAGITEVFIHHNQAPVYANPISSRAY